MTRPKPHADHDNPPTSAADWAGAEVLQRGERHAQRTGSLTFHLFRASNNRDLFLVTDHGEASRLPECPGGAWQLFKVLPETGKPRIGFSEADAKRDIAQLGYHLGRINLTTREHAHG